MKRVLSYLLVYFTAFTTIYAEVPSDQNIEKVFRSIESFTQIECSFKPREPQNRANTIPNIRVKKDTSSNWSGYVAMTNLQKPQKNSVSYVYGAWTVPTLSSTPDDSFCSAWVGIDGDQSNTVEQIGTEHDWSNGSQQNSAWFEMFPNPSYDISGFPLQPGDVVAGVVNYIGSSTFQLMLINYTQKVFVLIPTSYTKSSTAKRVCAEWIVEAPWLNQTLPLANFGTIAFSDCSATIRNFTGPINSSHWKNNSITMVGPGNVTKATPSGLSNGGTAFTVTWSHE